jgi:lipopolysaccharide transport system ATP-binding protein
VIVVSHNMAAITSLCSRAAVLRSGRVVFVGEVNAAVAEYAARDASTLVRDLRGRADRSGSGEIRCVSLALRNMQGELTTSVRPNEPFEIVVSYEAKAALKNLAFSVDVELFDGTRIVTLYSAFRNELFSVAPGRGAFSCEVAGLPLRPDTYSLNAFIGAYPGVYDSVERAMAFDIAPVDVFGTGRMPDRAQGPLLAEYHWHASELTTTPR